MPADLLADDDLDPVELMDLVADALSMTSGGVDPRLVGRKIALIFEKPSTRTRVSFESAIVNLGGHPLVLRSEDMQLSRGESVQDTGRVLSSYVDGIVLRTHGQERLEAFAGSSSVPVINALSDSFHPCQALADLLTIRQLKGHLEGVALAYVGDGNNVANSLLLSGAAAGLHVRIASPGSRQPDPSIVGRARDLAAVSGGSISISDSPRSAVRDADVVYTDVWQSMGDDEAPTDELFAGFTVDDELVRRADSGCIVMHCLPAHRGKEIAASVIDGPRSAVWRQAANRVPAQMAVLALLVG
jgi:ornithine carbamoyltransferase